jgi:hypothetical protein
MNLAYKERVSKVESAARKFAVAGAIGLGVLAGAERDAAAQTRVAAEPIFELMPVHVLGYQSSRSVEAGPGKFIFNATAARPLKSEAWMGLALGQKSRSSISIGASYETFYGFGSYSGPAPIRTPMYDYSGHSIGAGAILRTKFGDEGTAPELTAYGSAAYRAYEAVLTGSRGMNGDDASALYKGWGLGQGGIELALPSSARFSIRRLGAGIVSDPRNAFVFASLSAAMLRGSPIMLRSTLSPNLSLMHGQAGAGADIRPFEVIYQAGKHPENMKQLIAAPGLKYAYSPESHMFAAYGSATYSLQRMAGVSADLSAQAGYMFCSGSEKTVPNTMFGALSLGLTF